MVTAQNIARAVRQPGFSPPKKGSSPPAAFMVAPTTIARAAVNKYHVEGEATAKEYIQGSALGEWSGSRHRSLASSAQNVIDGLAAYMAADQADGRAVASLAQVSIIKLPSGPVKVRVDVVLEDGADLSGRIVLWDGPDFKADQVPVIAAAYSEGLRQLYPKRTIRSIGVWQGRRQNLEEVSFARAQAHLRRADAIVAAF